MVPSLWLDSISLRPTNPLHDKTHLKCSRNGVRASFAECSRNVGHRVGAAVCLADGENIVNQFYSLNHAKGIIGIWKEDYNTTRPHSSLGYLAPAVYAQQCTH